MFPPPPSSPLFPYTTLFRSRGDPADGLDHVAGAEPRLRGGRARDRPPRRRDRKSTRLNSSHRCISYAVFCLKKKKKKQQKTKLKKRDSKRTRQYANVTINEN